MYYRSRRVPADMRGAVMIGGRECAVRILNVSESGMKISLAQQVAPGTPITFLGLRGDLPGVIRWSDGREAGMQFDRALSAAEVAELAGVGWSV